MFTTLITELDALAAFVKKDVRSRITYKLNLSLSFLNTLVAAMTWAILGQNAELGAALAPYGGSFITYLIVGMAFNEYMIESLKAVQKSVTRSELEGILASPIKLRTFIFGNVLWGYAFHTINILIYFSIGIFVFGITFGSVDYVGALVTLVLGIVVMFSFSLLASGILIVTKQGDVIQWVLGALSGLFAGVYFPIALLPEKMQAISWILPQTYFFELIRMALNGERLIEFQLNTISPWSIVLIAFGFVVSVMLILLGRASTQMKKKRNSTLLLSGMVAATFLTILLGVVIVGISVHPLMTTLALYALVMMPIGYLVFKKGLALSKKKGTLSHI